MRRILNRLAKPVALLVVAAQLLLGVPAMAAVQAPAGAETHAPCDAMSHSAPVARHDGGCPCCPDESASMKDCLASCSLAAAITPTLFVVAVTPSHTAPLVEYSDHLSALSDPPVKPPPIA